MAESVDKGNLIVYSCPICLEKITRPKRLPCLHTFCEKCLQIFISRASVGKDPEKFDFECPLCRRVTGRPEPGISVDEWAKHFPTDILINSLTSSIDEKSDNKYCAICLRDDKKSKAEYWCNDCAEAICASCKRLHQIVGSLQKHKISTLRFHDKDDKFCFPELDEPCHLHEGKYVDVFCVDHEKLCCCMCVATEHRQCEHVETVNDVATKIPKLVVESNIDVLSAISTTTKEVLNHKEKAIIHLNAQKEEILKNVSEEVSSIKTKLDELQQQFRKTLLKKHEDIEEEMKQCVFDMKQYLLIVNNGEALLSAVKERGTPTQIFLSTRKTIRDVEDQFKQFKSRNPKDKEYDYKHDHKTILKQYCEHDKIDDIRVEAKPSGTLWNLSLHMSSFQMFANVEKVPQSMIFENKTNAELLNAEKKCEFQLPTCTEQGVFVDNKTLAFASSSNTLSFHNVDESFNTCIYSMELKGKPYLWVGPTRYILYIGCLSTVQKLKIKKNCDTVRVNCVGEVDVEQDFDIFSVDEEQNRIIIASQTSVVTFALSPTLSIIHTITTPHSDPIMTLSKTFDRFACVHGDKVICYSMTGDEIFRYQCNSLMNSKSLVFDCKNNIYVVFSSPRISKCNHLDIGICGICYCHTYFSGRTLDTLLEENAVCKACKQRTYLNCQNGSCRQPINAHLQSGGVYLINRDENNIQCLLSKYPGALFMSFNQSYDEFLISDGTECTVYKLG